ncbi:MAG: ribosome recycling factor [Legionellales bacterium]|nr:ribosome recycling factor [Legionellales bacterium]
MIETLKQDVTQRMKKSVETFKNNLAKIRTGRAHPSLLEHITVLYYGNPSPLNQVASVTAADARSLMITPWEKNMVEPIEKAIMNADLGLNPVTVGMNIRVPLPALTEERRKEMTKVVRGEGEDAKVAVRNIRRDANNHLKELLKSKDITEDDQRRAEEAIQKMTDKHIAEIDALLATKEQELMEV